MKSFCFLLILLAACNRPDPAPPVNEEEMREHMINANRILVEEEAKDIDEFIGRHGWTMKKSGSGLRYDIYQAGTGKACEPGKPVTVAYKAWLLNGTPCAESDSLHPVTFLPGKGQQPRGLEEGLVMLKEGGRARLVLPAHLAYGTAGDGKKIPGNAALYYDVQLLPTHATH